MQKEETIFFPSITAKEPFLPIAKMQAEHESAGEVLATICGITKNFDIPEYACVICPALITGLQELEQNLPMHIHLENPRATQREAA